jgi:hypothetical protein
VISAELIESLESQMQQGGAVPLREVAQQELPRSLEALLERLELEDLWELRLSHDAPPLVRPELGGVLLQQEGVRLHVGDLAGFAVVQLSHATDLQP